MSMFAEHRPPTEITFRDGKRVRPILYYPTARVVEEGYFLLSIQDEWEGAPIAIMDRGHVGRSHDPGDVRKLAYALLAIADRSEGLS